MLAVRKDGNEKDNEGGSKERMILLPKLRMREDLCEVFKLLWQLFTARVFIYSHGYTSYAS